jgi:hypothetical protein
MTFSYIGAMIVWFLLGAVINPFKYLPYAAAAITLVFVRTFRYKHPMEGPDHHSQAGKNTNQSEDRITAQQPRTVWALLPSPLWRTTNQVNLTSASSTGDQNRNFQS